MIHISTENALKSTIASCINMFAWRVVQSFKRLILETNIDILLTNIKEKK